MHCLEALNLSPSGGKVIELNIYDIQGQLVKKLLNSELSAGNYLISWEGKNEFGQHVSSGIYIYEVKSAAKRFTGKMNLLR